MTIDEILLAFGTADEPPEAALRAAVGQAAALAPHVIALAEMALRGVTLVPRQERIVRYGLHALAAARETSVYPVFLQLLGMEETWLERCLGRDVGGAVVAMLLSFHEGGGAGPLYDMLTDPAIDGLLKLPLFEAAARLAWEGRIPCEEFVDFLDSFDRDDLAPPQDAAWLGWVEAIGLLGLTAMADRVEARWARVPEPSLFEAFARTWRDHLADPATDPDDPRYFIQARIEPMGDPFERLTGIDATVEHVRALLEAARAKAEGDGEREDIPDKEVGEEFGPEEFGPEGFGPEDFVDDDDGYFDPEALDDDELDWLAGFLVGREAPAKGMDLEQIDGCLTALAIGPERVPRDEWLQAIWEGSDGPDFDSDEQRAVVLALLDRHAAAITRRAESGRRPAPFLFPGSELEERLGWAQGFIAGADLRRDAWKPMFADPFSGIYLGPIVGLAFDEAALARAGRSSMKREPRPVMLRRLPHAIRAINAYWRLPPEDRPRLSSAPARSAKVGRNDPCPCGSGKKYKKCHGAAA